MYIYIHTHTYIQAIIVNEHGRQPDLSTTWQLLQELDATLRCHQTQLEDPLEMEVLVEQFTINGSFSIDHLPSGKLWKITIING